MHLHTRMYNFLIRSLLIHTGHRRGFNCIPSLASRVESFEDQEKLQYDVGCDLMYKLVCRRLRRHSADVAWADDDATPCRDPVLSPSQTITSPLTLKASSLNISVPNDPWRVVVLVPRSRISRAACPVTGQKGKSSSKSQTDLGLCVTALVAFCTWLSMLGFMRRYAECGSRWRLWYRWHVVSALPVSAAPSPSGLGFR